MAASFAPGPPAVLVYTATLSLLPTVVAPQAGAGPGQRLDVGLIPPTLS